MTFTEAAAEVLRLAGKPLHYKEITELAIEKNLLSHVGKSPEVTMGARLAALLKKEDKTNPIVRVKPGIFALREWDEKGKKKGAKAEDVARASEDDADDDTGINALEVEAAAARESMPPPAARDFDDDSAGDVSTVSGEDALRAEMAAQGADLFDDEDDDDQPIFGAPAGATAAAGTPGAAGAAGDPLGADGGRRRRRRRRRGRGGAGEFGERASSPRLPGISTGPARPDENGGVIQPTPTIAVDGEPTDSMRDPLAPPPRPMVRDRQQIMAGGAPSGIEVPLGEGDELAGRELADAALIVLGSLDRGAGPAPVRTLVDGLMRRGRLAGDPAAAALQLGASLRADNLRRTAAGQRVRFRFATGGRVAPTEWLLGADLVRLEQEVLAAADRYRDAARRLMLRRLQELPGHAFVELALLCLERVGLTQIRSVRRAGSSGGEAHFAAVHRSSAGDEVKTAVVLRKDGRELGRERVSDLRGALHHYGPAAAGWLITTGQVLSGAREEAAAPAAPVALFDGLALCKLLEEHEVGVIRTRVTIPLPDLELLETLRG